MQNTLREVRFRYSTFASEETPQYPVDRRLDFSRKENVKRKSCLVRNRTSVVLHCVYAD
jgi:hypothetical protein